MMSFSFSLGYTPNTAFSRRVAYFSMEFGIHQALKTYAGGLGFLAGSHMRSAYELKQNLVGIGILWKYGYYDQVRKYDQSMDVLFQEKIYGFLQKTDIRFTIRISGHPVIVTAWYLPPQTFKTVPVFLLTTDIPENDHLARTICHRLYDPNPETRIAAAILLGQGGARLLEAINWQPETFHLNESHALPLVFYLYDKYKNIEEIKERLVFTNHTPETAGNQKTSTSLLEKMGFFCGVPLPEIRAIAHEENGILDYTLTALRFAGRANAVSQMHQKTISQIWSSRNGYCDILAITNAQHYGYWHHEAMYTALKENDDEKLLQVKHGAKQDLFEEVADQAGELYKPDICTIVFAKRFTGYKRADLLLYDMERFHRLVTNPARPVQIIWAGKPYPMDYAGIGVFDKIADICKTYSNCAILVGYELRLSKLLKQGADVWLNVPRITHEASGTSGMTAAMNGAVNLSIPDGWFPEFAKDKINSFVIPPADAALPEHIEDEQDADAVYNLLEKELLPLYYDYPGRWLQVVKQGMTDILPQFDSNRMAAEYYERLYHSRPENGENISFKRPARTI